MGWPLLGMIRERAIAMMVAVGLTAATIVFGAQGRSRVVAAGGRFAPTDSAAQANWIARNLAEVARQSQPVGHYLTESRAESLAYATAAPRGSIWLHRRPYWDTAADYYGFVKFYNDTVRALAFINPVTGVLLRGEADPIYSAWADTFSVPNNETDPHHVAWLDSITQITFDPSGTPGYVKWDTAAMRTSISAGASEFLKFPASDGITGQILKTDGSGDMFWEYPDTGSVATEVDPIFGAWLDSVFTDVVTIDTLNNRVGISTTTPKTEFHVSNGNILASSSGYIRSSVFSDTTGGATIQGISEADNSYTRAWIGDNAHWNPTNNLWVVNNVGANDVAGWLFPNGGGVKLIVHGTSGASLRTFTHANFLTGLAFEVSSSRIATFYNDVILSEGGGATDFRNGVTSGTVLWTTPPDDGDANDVLKTDGAGVLRWEAESDPVFVAWVNQTPQAPANLTLTEIVSPTNGTKTAINVLWDANAATDSVQGYQYEVRLAEQSSTFDDGGVSDTTFIFPSVMISQDSTYCFRVRAVGQRVVGAWCDWDSLTVTGDVTPPSAPTSPAATANNAWSNTVEWTPPTDADLAWIEVLESPDSDTLNGSIIARVPQPGDYAYVAYVGSGSTQRWYWVRAVDDVGNHSVPWTAAGSPTTAAALTADITDEAVTTGKLAATVGDGKVWRTAASGQRIVLNGISNRGSMFNSADKEVLRFAESALNGLYLTNASGDEFMWGDCDRDGLLTSNDPVAILDSVTAVAPYTDECDCSRNGAVTAYDATVLSQYLAIWSWVPSADPGFVAWRDSTRGVLTPETIATYRSDNVTTTMSSATGALAISVKQSSTNDTLFSVNSAGAVYSKSTITAASSITGARAIVTEDSSYTIGDPSTDGSWRIATRNDSTFVQNRLSGTWVQRMTLIPNGNVLFDSIAVFLDGINEDIHTYDEGGAGPPSNATLNAAFPTASIGDRHTMRDANNTSALYEVQKTASTTWRYWASTACP